MIGHKKTNITDNSVHKYNMHGSYVASAVRTYDEGPKYGASTDTEKYNAKQHTVPLTKHNFHVRKKEMTRRPSIDMFPFAVDCLTLF